MNRPGPYRDSGPQQMLGEALRAQAAGAAPRPGGAPRNAGIGVGWVVLIALLAGALVGVGLALLSLLVPGLLPAIG